MQIALDSERIDRSNNDAFASYVSRHTKPDDDEFRRRRPLPTIDQLSLESKQIFHCLWDLGAPKLDLNGNPRAVTTMDNRVDLQVVSVVVVRYGRIAGRRVNLEIVQHEGFEEQAKGLRIG